MAFLFKSKKGQERSLQSREGPPGSASSVQSAAGRIASGEKNGAARSTPTGSVNSFDDASGGSPDLEKFAARRAEQGQATTTGPQGQQTASDLPFRNMQQQPQQSPSQAPHPNAALFPWSQRRLTFQSSTPSPFPRYGAAVNAVSSKEGDIYVMGGLINSSTVKGDLWMIEAGGNMSCYPLATTSEGPGPRVGHASLLVGNAFIVYGGDTKIDESDVLDETLYLLNTSTRQWSRALPAGSRPSGRYGHTLNILGSKIFIFGGQVEGYFMNDLAAFDLNQLQMPNNKWEILFENAENGTSPQGKVPPARTNHSMITYGDKMYLFGGTNGFQWFNDVWCYDPQTNKWAQLDCIGYIPVPREGHAAALVDDVMYIFGGRTEDGNDLGDLAAFRITSRRWYTFQNMGPSPSPRSGHSMTAVGKSIVVVGGEPSSATNTVNDLSIVFVLDTNKIRYPNDVPAAAAGQKQVQGRRPSGETAPGTVNRPPQSRDGSTGPPEAKKQLVGPPGSPKNANVVKGPNGVEANGSRLPRAAGTLTPSGPPPQGQAPKPAINTTMTNGAPRNASLERVGKEDASPIVGSQTSSPIVRDVIKEEGPAAANVRKIGGEQVTRSASKNENTLADPKSKLGRPARGPGSVDSNAEFASKNIAGRPASPPPPTRQPSNPLARRSSGRNSQTVTLLKELDSARNRNAWYASELELARKNGFVSAKSLSPVLESRGTETFDDEDRPLIEALIAMRQELANVQSSVDKQAILAAKQIAEAERQRDAAIAEAVYAKAKIAAHSSSAASTPQLDNERDIDDADRVMESNRKLAASLNRQKDLEIQLARASAELEAEKQARQLADETSNASHMRMSDLEMYKQQTSLEVESLRAQLHAAQQEAREKSILSTEATSTLDLLQIEKAELEQRLAAAGGPSEEQGESLSSLQRAVAASADLKNHFETKLDEERTQREKVETKLTKLKAEHETRTAELVAISQRLRDAEELADRHATEAKTHREALLSGLDKITADGSKSSKADADRIVALQGQIAAASNLVRKYQQEADTAADKLRSAEERIAGLEAYQEQSSREGVTIRRQLQGALKDTQSLQAMNSDLKNQLASQQLEANAISVQHNALKDILTERGISPTGATRLRGMGSRADTPDASKAAELEQQLAEARAAHEETKQNFASQVQESETAYRERISQLENDYQSAVHYVKGTEKMLKKLKEELAKYKTENSRLKSENIELEERSPGSAPSSRDVSTPAGWENERSMLEEKIKALESEAAAQSAHVEKQLASIRNEFNAAKQERDQAVRTGTDASKRFAAKQKEFEQLQHERALLEKRAQDAEQKVSMLLDQVESSVDNYRRRSRQVGGSLGSVPLGGETPQMNGTGALGHARQESSEAESLYGGLGDARNSAALDNLADELDQLRSHWEATNKSYRLSNTFDFEGDTMKKDDDGVGLGLSASLADWRKRLDSQERDGGLSENGNGSRA